VGAALETLERAGLLDDARVGAARAEQLAARGFGNAAIRFALEGEGLAAEVVDDALATLDPEPERASRLLAARGRTPKTLRWLATKGFDQSTLEDLGGFADGG
jgi:SOS response regulatory protein OraA/RecX